LNDEHFSKKVFKEKFDLQDDPERDWKNVLRMMQNRLQSRVEDQRAISHPAWKSSC
jgi:hypothetical protein